MSDSDWWQRGTIYQLVLPSFRDSDGDGIGDLPGLIEKLDYLAWLGVTGIWLSPFHPTPFRELGYEIVDYQDVDSRFGSLEIFDRLVAEARARGLRIIVDWVSNHTADEHPWFEESRASRTSAKRNWYLWRDAKPDGSPPNNWISVFGGSVWQWDERTGAYYLHTFLRSQPDLNWREPAVRDAIKGAMRFWLDKGVDGFRLDAAGLLLKDAELRDNPENPDYAPGDLPDSRLLPERTRNQPGLHELLAELRAVVDERGADKVLLGEFYLPADAVVTFYGRDPPELQLPLNLALTYTEWNADAVGRCIEAYQAQVPAHGWPTTTIGTHDQPRLATRVEGEQTRTAAMLLLTQRGTPTLYYGDEIGMRGVPIPPERARDPQGQRTGRNRDPERTPMQWSDEGNTGFSSGKPWLPVGADVATANVAAQRTEPRSLLALYRRLIALRVAEPVLIDGAHEPIVAARPVLMYRRRGAQRTLLVALNLGAASVECPLERGRVGRVLLSTVLDREGERTGDTVSLRPDEGLIIALE